MPLRRLVENNTPVPEVLAETPDPQKSSGFSPLWLIAVIIIVLLIAGVVLYSQKQNKVTEPASSNTESNINTLETELNNLDEGTNDSDLNALEKDLQNL